MVRRDTIDVLKESVATADGIPSLLRTLNELQTLEAAEESGEDLDHLRLEAFESLARLTQGTPGEAGPIILSYLLPLCLRGRNEWRVPRVAYRYDEALSVWLDRFPAIHRYLLRASVLEALADAICGAAAERAARLIGMLRYRDELLSIRLLDLARSGGDAIRDVALHVRTVLGMSASQHATLVQLWSERAYAVPWNLDLIGVAKQLASAEILGLVFDRWLISENLDDTDVGHGFLPNLAIALPAAVAERSPNDAGLQDRIWDQLQGLESAAPRLFFNRVLGSSQVANPCNSPGVVRYYLSRLTDSTRNRDLAYFRLEECIRPRHLLGWSEDPGHEVIGTVLRDAMAVTGMVGSFTTQEFRRKLYAWEALLSLARMEVLTNVEAAVAGESNGHAVGAILDIAACFRLATVPPTVRALIAAEFKRIPEDDSERVYSHVSAISVARASGSPSAFDALLGFNLIREGGVLIGLIEALADTAASLIREGNADAVDRLWEAVAPGKREHRRTAAAAALGRLLRRNILRTPPADRIAEILEDESLDRYARREVLEGLGHLPVQELSPKIVQALWRAVTTPPVAADGNREAWRSDFRPVALASLGRLGLLAASPDALRQHVGFRLEGTTWRYDRPPIFPGASVVVGILYAKEPGAFGAAVADLLRTAEWTAVAQLAPSLRAGPRPAPEVVVHAILERIRRAHSKTGEPDLVLLLADLAPERIASESWSEMFEWPPQVRASLAAGLARSQQSGVSDRRVNLLMLLMGDSQYGVRREAFRAMARIKSENLRYVCNAWAFLTEANVKPQERPYVIDMRRRAAEAAGWLESLPTEGPIAELAWDPEPEVRMTFERCQRERRDREWAEVYLRHVLGVHDDTSLIKAWKYGRALERVGDDRVLEHLEERRRQDLEPGIRHWLGRIIKKLRAHWDEVTRGWPEPWFARRGGLERVEASVGDDAKAKSVSCWLWQVPPSDLVEFGVWGGWCPDELLPNEVQTLNVPGRRQATILVTNVIGWTGPTYFVGSGSYPEPATAGE